MIAYSLRTVKHGFSVRWKIVGPDGGIETGAMFGCQAGQLMQRLNVAYSRGHQQGYADALKAAEEVAIEHGENDVAKAIAALPIPGKGE